MVTLVICSSGYLILMAPAKHWYVMLQGHERGDYKKLSSMFLQGIQKGRSIIRIYRWHIALGGPGVVNRTPVFLLCREHTAS